MSSERVLGTLRFPVLTSVMACYALVLIAGHCQAAIAICAALGLGLAHSVDEIVRERRRRRARSPLVDWWAFGLQVGTLAGRMGIAAGPAREHRSLAPDLETGGDHSIGWHVAQIVAAAGELGAPAIVRAAAATFDGEFDRDTIAAFCHLVTDCAQYENQGVSLDVGV